MAWSCATWFREPCQVRKEAAVSGVPGAPQPTGPEWSALRARAALQREGVRGQINVRIELFAASSSGCVTTFWVCYPGPGQANEALGLGGLIL